MNSVSNHKGVAEILKILAAIPCYNESLAIGSVALKARRHVDEVLVSCQPYTVVSYIRYALHN